MYCNINTVLFLLQPKVLPKFHQEAVSKNVVNQLTQPNLCLLQDLTQGIDLIQMLLHPAWVST